MLSPSACVSDTVTYLSEVATCVAVLGFAVIGIIVTALWVGARWGLLGGDEPDV